MDRPGTIAISEWSADDALRRIGEIGALLHACVHAGASVGYILPFAPGDAEAFWRLKVLPSLEGGSLRLMVAEDGGAAVGTVQLDCGTPPNQPHRAEVRKLLVHPLARRRGVARALMAGIEEVAAGMGRTLLTLDTRTGDAAEPLYASLGYAVVGIVPGYCLDPGARRLDSTTIMYKILDPAPPPAARGPARHA